MCVKFLEFKFKFKLYPLLLSLHKNFILITIRPEYNESIHFLHTHGNIWKYGCPLCLLVLFFSFYKYCQIVKESIYLFFNFSFGNREEKKNLIKSFRNYAADTILLK